MEIKKSMLKFIGWMLKIVEKTKIIVKTLDFPISLFVLLQDK